MGKANASVCTYHTSDCMGQVLRPSETTTIHHQVPSESKIRFRLLNRLGIHQKKPPISAAPKHRHKHAIQGHANSTSTSMRKTPAHFCLPLRDERDEEIPGSLSSYGSMSPPSPCAPTSPYVVTLDGHERQDQQNEMPEHDKSNKHGRRRIQFNTNVMVVPIPSRHAYSKRIRQAFWMDGAEIQATAERNRYEFASEGWDYQQVLEDEDMYMDLATGQLVHPCWVEDEDEEDGGLETSSSNKDGQHNKAADDRLTSPNYGDQAVEAKTSSLRRTTSGIFDVKDVESVNEEQTVENPAATA